MLYSVNAVLCGVIFITLVNIICAKCGGKTAIYDLLNGTITLHDDTLYPTNTYCEWLIQGKSQSIVMYFYYFFSYLFHISLFIVNVNFQGNIVMCSEWRSPCRVPQIRIKRLSSQILQFWFFSMTVQYYDIPICQQFLYASLLANLYVVEFQKCPAG